jgi:hypothetical protein
MTEAAMAERDDDPAIPAASLTADILERAVRQFATGARRNGGADKEHRRYDLLPREAIYAYAMHMGRGAAEHGARNWERGIPLSTYYNSAMDHLLRYGTGYRDEPHLEAALWNVACLVATRSRIRRGLLPRELDDMPELPPDVLPGY